jgi:hypothetical protein
MSAYAMFSWEKWLPFLSTLLLGMVLISCQPEDQIILVPDNTAPPDLSVAEVLKENYVNKLFISLLGRKPTEAEMGYSLAILAQDNASVEKREEVIDLILDQPEYPQKVYESYRAKLLPGLDTTEITIRIAVYQTLLDSPAYEPFYGLIEFEIDRYEKLKATPYQFSHGGITRIEVHKRLINNGFFDEINMGSQNFVLALFEHFLNRYPTEAELANSESMVDGSNALVFGKEGQSKPNFINIFFDSDDYYEGEVVAIYQDFLFRQPNSQEMSLHTIAYKQNQDYGALLKRILTTDEYLGL